MTHRAHLYSRKIRKNSARVPPVDNDYIEEVANDLLKKSKLDDYGMVAKAVTLTTTEEDYAGRLVYLDIELITNHDSRQIGKVTKPVVGGLEKRNLDTLSKNTDANSQIIEKIQDVGIDIYAKMTLSINSYIILAALGLDYAPTLKISLDNDDLEIVLSGTRNAIREALKHEWVHLQDPAAESSSKKMRNYRNPAGLQPLVHQWGDESLNEQEKREIAEEIEEGMDEYFSHEVEVRAFMQNVINELESKIDDSVTPDNTPLTTVIEESEYWKQIRKHMDTPARNKMLQALYTWYHVDRPKKLSSE